MSTAEVFMGGGQVSDVTFEARMNWMIAGVGEVVGVGVGVDTCFAGRNVLAYWYKRTHTDAAVRCRRCRAWRWDPCGQERGVC
jgi:hypothetical protein